MCQNFLILTLFTNTYTQIPKGHMKKSFHITYLPQRNATQLTVEYCLTFVGKEKPCKYCKDAEKGTSYKLSEKTH